MSTATPMRIGPTVTRHGATRAAMIALLALEALLLAITVLVLARLGPTPAADHGPQPAPAPAPAPVVPR
jgi:hypothetical protein